MGTSAAAVHSRQESAMHPPILDILRRRPRSDERLAGGLLLGLLCGLAACGEAMPRPLLPPPVPLTDINPDPRIVEVELVASLSNTE